MRTYIHSDEESRFEEDMELKGRWLEELRGKMSDKAVYRQRQRALKQVDRLRKARTAMRDPGGGPPKRTAVLVGARRGIRIKRVDNPKESDSGNFVSHCFQVSASRRYTPTFLKIKPKRGAARHNNLQTAKVFYYDPRMAISGRKPCGGGFTRLSACPTIKRPFAGWL
jgi:hypothetical protein